MELERVGREGRERAAKPGQRDRFDLRVPARFDREQADDRPEQKTAEQIDDRRSPRRSLAEDRAEGRRKPETRKRPAASGDEKTSQQSSRQAILQSLGTERERARSAPSLNAR